MKRIKNIVSLFFVLIFAFSLAACQSNTNEQTESANQENGSVAVDQEAEDVVTVTISKNNGEEMIETKDVEIKEGQTVLDVMNENFELDTAYEGTFITGINGEVADESKSESWFYSVNGEEAMVGAAEYKLEPGDKLEFDLHSWE